MKKTIVAAIAFAGLSGCAGSISYQQPEAYKHVANEKVINKPIEEVWTDAVPALGKQFFVINNLDKGSGLINISYSGDPEKYVDCGRIDSQVTNLRGKRHYNFSGSSQAQQYEIMHQGNLFYVNRKMSLEGRINLIFEAVSKSKTKVTANTKYVVTKTLRVSAATGGFPQTMSDSISFNSNSGAVFPGAADSTSRCVATGQMEKEVLSVIPGD